LGYRYGRQRERILKALLKRNNSIFAHGITSLTENAYGKVRETLVGFIAKVAEEIGISIALPELPRSEETWGRYFLPEDGEG